MNEDERHEHAEAQDIIDAIRFALMAQNDEHEALRLVKALLEHAPESDGQRGIKFLLDLICEGSLKVAMV